MGYLKNAFFRSLFIQSSWNFERMQNLGFFFSVAPAIKAIHKDEVKLREASERHIEFFNTNPYMAPAIIGATIRLEEEGRPAEEIKGLKTGLMGPYGGVGDSFFWSALRPLAAISGVFFTMQGLLWGPLIFLVVFNVPHLFMRIYGMRMGYKTGTGIVGVVKGLELPGKVRRIKSWILFLSGTILAGLLSAAGGGIRKIFYDWRTVLILAAVYLFYQGLERGFRVETMAVWTVVLSVAVFMII